MHARLFITACASAALLSGVACNTNSTKNDTDQTRAAADTASNAKATGTSGDRDVQQPITINGCLQKDGSDYILTAINEPPKGEPVAQQDAKEAEHAYRLDAKNTSDDGWDKMVGHQVHVSGTLARRGDVAQKVGTSGTSDEKDHPKIHESDLAQVDVSNIQVTAASCGASAAHPKAAAKPRRK